MHLLESTPHWLLSPCFPLDDFPTPVLFCISGSPSSPPHSKCLFCYFPVTSEWAKWNFHLPTLPTVSDHLLRKLGKKCSVSFNGLKWLHFALGSCLRRHSVFLPALPVSLPSGGYFWWCCFGGVWGCRFSFAPQQFQCHYYKSVCCWASSTSGFILFTARLTHCVQKFVLWPLSQVWQSNK